MFPLEEPSVQRLLDFYPHAISDFWGSGEFCVYKTGPSWPVTEYDEKIVRSARPIHKHPITPIWRKTARSIVAVLDAFQVKFNTVNPLAYANAGEADLICNFVITIGVEPGSLTFEAAVAAGAAVSEVLQTAGFPDIQVAFVESVYHRHGANRPKLMNFNAPVPFELWDILPGWRKPFTPTLGLSIAPLESPHYEGSGGLFFRLSADKADKRVALLTCAHVAHPPPLFENKAYTRNIGMDIPEQVILLGSGSYDVAVGSLEEFINGQPINVGSCEFSLRELPEPVEGEEKQVTSKRKELTSWIQQMKLAIEEADKLHTDVTKNFTTFASRIIGFVLHTSKIDVGEDQFIQDWSFIQLDEHKIDWDNFEGNKLFVGGNKTSFEWSKYMFRQYRDHPHDIHHPDPVTRLLPLQTDHVPEAEFRSPRDRDIHNAKALLAVKNGGATGTTFGRVNGLESITRHYPTGTAEAPDGGNGGPQDALEFVVCGYDKPEEMWQPSRNEKFSERGDSGAIVVGRDGRLIGQITGGAGSTDETDKTYITPYFSLKKAIEKEYPGCYPLPGVA